MRFATLLPVIACLACALAPASPAHAQSKENLRKLSDAYKLIQEDSTAEAITQLDGVLEEAPDDSDAAAKAMLLRGQAYAKAGRHAQALADFNAALWLQGLSSSQRKDAVEGRKAALAKLGLADKDSKPPESGTASPPESATSPAPQAAPTARAQTKPEQPTSTAWRTDVEAAEQQDDDSSGIGSFFSELFGGNSDGPAEQTASVATTNDPPAASGWATSTSDLSGTSAGSSGDGRQYRVQIASLGTREGAESEARRLTRILGDAMAGESPSIVRTDTDAGNTYYRIMVGPTPSRDTAEEMCQMFKSRGVDCLVLSSR